MHEKYVVNCASTYYQGLSPTQAAKTAEPRRAAHTQGRNTAFLLRFDVEPFYEGLRDEATQGTRST